MNIFRYRIDLDEYEHDSLLRDINEGLKKGDDCSYLLNKVKAHLESAKKIEKSIKKTLAADKAREARQDKVKSRIYVAIKALEEQNKPPTAYQISKLSGVSFQTVKKYLFAWNKEQIEDKFFEEFEAYKLDYEERERVIIALLEKYKIEQITIEKVRKYLNTLNEI